MTSLLMPFIALFALFILALWGSGRASFGYQMQRATGVWTKWMPVYATGLFVALLLFNLSAGNPARSGSASLYAALSQPEMVLLLLAVPFFLTSFGNLVALAALIYCVARFLWATQPTLPLPLYLLTGCLTMVAVLGDRQPWLKVRKSQTTARFIRKILLFSLTLSALTVIFLGFIQARDLSRWLAALYGFNTTRPLLTGLLMLLSVGWLGVSVRIFRPFIIPLLSLPTVLILAYLSGWPSPLLVLPFILALALSLATVDRREQSRVIDARFSRKLS